MDGKGERLSLRSRPASANLAETAAFMDGTKRILVFSIAGGTGRSYHADLSCANTERRIHCLLEPGWHADRAIQGLGRTHRTHHASAPLFRPVTTDVKGERRFIATIARRLDSLGAITRGQRDSQTAMGGSNAALFRESDNLERPRLRLDHHLRRYPECPVGQAQKREYEHTGVPSEGQVRVDRRRPGLDPPET